MAPLVIYDNECYLCVQFAKLVNFLAKGRLHFVGHYTDFGKQIREDVLDSNALEMFWFIDTNTAYGGRAALGPLFSTIFNISKKACRTKKNCLWTFAAKFTRILYCILLHVFFTSI